MLPRELDFSERAFDAIEEVLEAAEQNVADCPCQN